MLEVGCGSGLQLKTLHLSRPGLELFGLDLTAPAIRNARRNLAGYPVDLQVGTIERTDYPSEFFDMVTCFASMSYREDLIACFDEIHRLLKPGAAAWLVEPQRDIDMDQVVHTIRTNLAEASPLRRFLAANLNRFGPRWGRKIGLRLYGADTIRELAAQSLFGAARQIEQVSVQRLPIFMLIQLEKAA